MKTSGFSKLSQQEKIQLLLEQTKIDQSDQLILESFTHKDASVQETIDNISENVVSNFQLPFSVAPNFLVDGQYYTVPMVTEESSIVAAASYAAKFWSERGGFQCKVLGNYKVGQLFVQFKGDFQTLLGKKSELFEIFKKETQHITSKMEQRGGGIVAFELIPDDIIGESIYELRIKFQTADAMGANFINSCLETMGHCYESYFNDLPEAEAEVIMAILSNYTPECVIEAKVSCELSELDQVTKDMNGKAFASKFVQAVNIARNNTSRAVTHNKGIFNGIDAVLVATGNDTRAVEACGHAYAAKDGMYKGLSEASIDGDLFTFKLTLPMAIGTVGGLTNIHPLVKSGFKILGNPNAETLAKIIVSVGLASNFAAVKALTTSGIQKGHMKLHLNNILTAFKATEDEKKQALAYFEEHTVSYSGVEQYLNKLRS